ncbi:hypothetical protein WDU94_009651 [Cyamophila willieti]
MTFFLLFQITEYHFDCLRSSIVIFWVCVILISCDDDSCFAIILIGVFWTFTCPPKTPMRWSNEAQKLYSKFPDCFEHAYQISSKSDKAFESWGGTNI